MATIDDIGVPGQPATNLTAWQAAVRDAVKANQTAVAARLTPAWATMRGHNAQATSAGMITWKSGASAGGPAYNAAGGTFGLLIGTWAIHWIFNCGGVQGGATTYLDYWNGTTWANLTTGVLTRSGHYILSAGTAMTVGMRWASGLTLPDDGAGSSFSAYKIG